RAYRALSRDARALRRRRRGQDRAQAPGLVHEGHAGLGRVPELRQLHRRSGAGTPRTRAFLRAVPAATGSVNEIDSAGQPDLRDQVAGLTFALVLLGPDVTIAQVNPAAENLIGRSARRLVGCKFLDVVRFAEERVLDRLLGEDAQLVARGLSVEVDGRTSQINLTISSLA